MNTSVNTLLVGKMLITETKELFSVIIQSESRLIKHNRNIVIICLCFSILSCLVLLYSLQVFLITLFIIGIPASIVSLLIFFSSSVTRVIFDKSYDAVYLVKVEKLRSTKTKIALLSDIFRVYSKLIIDEGYPTGYMVFIQKNKSLLEVEIEVYGVDEISAIDNVNLWLAKNKT